MGALDGLHGSIAMGLCAMGIGAMGFLREGEDFAKGFATILEKDVEGHLAELASPELEGRDSPSEGLTRAGDYIIARFQAAGLAAPGAEGEYRVKYTRNFQAPDAKRCTLVLTREGAEPETLVLEDDFVPLPACKGSARGAPVFVGFGIHEPKAGYDDFRGAALEGKIAVILEGEPRHKRLFEGPVVTNAADVHGKIAALAKEGAAGILVVRRVPERPSIGADGKPLAQAALGYRYTWAEWVPGRTDPFPERTRSFDLPVLEISAAAALRILGVDALELGLKMDKAGKPERFAPSGITLELSTGFADTSVEIANIAGVVEGTDTTLAAEYVVIGAHYDHIGVDYFGRIGCGADDNASGTTGLIEIAQAFASSPPKRSILCLAFSAEEDGLVGSRAFCRDPPIPKESLVAMLNMDMIGRGEDDLVVVLGTKWNPELEGVLRDAKKLKPTKIKSIVTDKAEHLWERSDHFSFHEIGVPVLFFFEAVSENENADYHTFRDTIELLSIDKIARTSRFVFNTAWLIANMEERPPAPRR